MKPKKYKLKRIHSHNIVHSVDESRFKINYQQALNASQYEAVSSVEGAYLIIAGAGTGKTQTLVYRVARLIELGYDPKSILLLTFTRKAANEMMRRASLLLDDRCGKIRGGTFHSFANVTLRRYSKAVGLASSFTILDQGDSADIINHRMDLSTIRKDFPRKIR